MDQDNSVDFVIQSYRFANSKYRLCIRKKYLNEALFIFCNYLLNKNIDSGIKRSHSTLAYYKESEHVQLSLNPPSAEWTYSYYL